VEPGKNDRACAVRAQGARSRTAARKARRGVTLLEIAIAVTILAIGLGTAVYALLGAMALQRSVAERSLALQAAESVMESIQGEVFAEAFARFNGTADDDPAGGLSPGDAFDVPGLQARPGDPDGLPGEIRFPGDNVLLLENVVDAELGMPRDLTLDEPPVIDNLDHAADYRVLPVQVIVRWRGATGNREVVLGTTLNNERKEDLP
jgi:prepilin-type N-terminal cleavage/methylation domain-containing protein